MWSSPLRLQVHHNLRVTTVWIIYGNSWYGVQIRLQFQPQVNTNIYQLRISLYLLTEKGDRADDKVHDITDPSAILHPLKEEPRRSQGKKKAPSSYVGSTIGEKTKTNCTSKRAQNRKQKWTPISIRRRPMSSILGFSKSLHMCFHLFEMIYGSKFITKYIAFKYVI